MPFPLAFEAAACPCSLPHFPLSVCASIRSGSQQHLPIKNFQGDITLQSDSKYTRGLASSPTLFTFIYFSLQETT